MVQDQWWPLTQGLKQSGINHFQPGQVNAIDKLIDYHYGPSSANINHQKAMIPHQLTNNRHQPLLSSSFCNPSIRYCQSSVLVMILCYHPCCCFFTSFSTTVDHHDCPSAWTNSCQASISTRSSLAIIHRH